MNSKQKKNPKSQLLYKLATQYNTPEKIQKFLIELDYNKSNTILSALTSIQQKKAHCLEGAFIAAALLEYYEYPPLVMSFESIDNLDHVIYVFQRNKKWGSIAKSRDFGLRGREPIFNSLKALAQSYFDPYVDLSGRITGFQVMHLDETLTNWRYSSRNVLKCETYMNQVPHQKLKSSDKKYEKLLESFKKNGPLPKKNYWW